MWRRLVPRFEGVHHGYFLPSEGTSDMAMAIFSFAAFEQYRKDAGADPDVQKPVIFREGRGFSGALIGLSSARFCPVIHRATRDVKRRAAGPENRTCRASHSING